MLMKWLADVFSHPTLMGAALIAGKTAAIYLFLVIGLRLLGKRELGQMNIYDLVLIIVLANAVQNAMVGDDNSLGGGLVSATTLLTLNRLFAMAMLRFTKLEHVMIGEPLVIVKDGELVQNCCRKEGVTRDQIMAALREHGIDKLDDVAMCVLEVDGTISVISRQASVQRTRRHFKALRLP